MCLTLRSYGRILQRIKEDLSDADSKKASRLLSWIIFAERPLKLHELLDGIAFCTSPNILDNTTKLTKRVLDLCKPIVEITREGVVSLVHFSAKQ